MSSDLSVKINRVINIDEFVKKVEKRLKILLNCKEIPRLYIYTLDKGQKTHFIDKVIGEKGQFFIIGIEKYDDGVTIIVTEISSQRPYTIEENEGIWLGISVGIKKSPIEFALAASIAIVVSEFQKTHIVDEACVWNDIFEISPKEFIKYVSVKNKHLNILEAAKEMFLKLKLDLYNK